jgi:hypothetical protein
MCLMLYIATAAPIGKEGRTRLTLKEFTERQACVRPWFSMPHVLFVSVDGGCSCGFAHVSAETAVSYYEGMFAGGSERENQIALASELIALIRECLSHGPRVELYPVWLPSESSAPKGTISLVASELEARTFFFNEQFFYEVTP